ncbi:MFS family permease [Cryobacterium mesophilum]|uniref:MFS transporter n=1 Tax=Terrimesophilobacter mesophilus TaxID=433647 RepID=A0A4V3I9S3_9MICO|nr:MFS transporter [Terrimesophilobacter mesophilus]MBB5633954.1 MFS family permease [Terrimesophilobacter mesophilus]TFB80618.1 MFS transporter [Terrimesophilobacter mesophilus]
MTLLRGKAGAVTVGLIGFLFFVEFVSGILQGFYVPLIPDLVKYLGIRDADFNIFEGAQLLLSALVVPILAKLGDMYGHKKILLVATVLTAGATWWLAFAGDFTSFLIAWTLQAFYVVWLPLEIALIFDKGRRSGRAASDTRKAAGLLIVGLEAGAIAGALGGSAVFEAFGGPEHLAASVVPTLMVPAIAVSLVFFVILFGVPESESLPGRTLDWIGFSILTIGLLLITSGLTFLKFNDDQWWPWAIMIAGMATFWPFVRFELRQKDPAIDIRVFAQPNMWPVQLTAFLVGISLLGAQAPLSTYAGTDRALGYGLGLTSGTISILIGLYLISMIVGALLFPLVSRWRTPRFALIAAAFLVSIGYLSFIPFHLETWQVFMNMAIAGLGSGALVGAMPAAAAAAAPRGQTGIASALTNTTKTIGGSFASSVFAIVLTIGAVQVAGSTAGSLFGYYLVWAICGVGALIAAVLLFFVPRLAFADDATVEDAEEVRA